MCDTCSSTPAPAHDIELVSNADGDWDRLYLDGELFAEGHSISHWDWGALLEVLGCGYTKTEVDEFDD